jgi:Trypsin-like peptidase domain
MRRVLQFLAIALVAAVAAPPAATAQIPASLQVVRAATVRSPGAFDREAEFHRQLDLQVRLAQEAARGALASPLAVDVGVDRLLELEGEAPSSGRLKVGVVAPVGRTVDFGGTLDRRLGGAAAPFGERLATASGVVWTGALRVAGATAVRVHFTGVDLPKGAELYVYNLAGEAHGPYLRKGPLGDGDFWAHTLSGEEVVVQLRLPQIAGAGAARFTVAEVGFLGERFPANMVVNPLGQLAPRSFCSGNATCVVDASCNNVGAVADAKDAVARMLFQSGGFLYLCSGGLLTDTAGSMTPYFLTANHCISKEREADTLQTFFQYRTTSCTTGGSCPSPGSASTLGADILAKDRSTDFTLMVLNQAPPPGSAFLGWNNQAVAFTNGVVLHRISHPLGSPQAYSRHRVDASAPTCSSWPRGDRIYSRDEVGATEGGSSGSPVVNANGEVVGQLSGACGTDVNNTCNAVDNATVDGAFAAYYDLVAPILTGGGGGGCTLGQPGDPCTSNSDCCSNKCTGPHNNKTCH